MRAGGGHPVGRLRNLTLTPQYRRHLREAGDWMLGKVEDLGGSLDGKCPSRKVDTWLERVVEWGHGHGEKLYWINLGVLSLQRRFKLSAPLLSGTWSAIRAWRTLQPIQPRVPITYYVLRCLLVVCLGRVSRTTGALCQEWCATFLGLWLAFDGMLRPGEVEGLRVKDFVFPEAAELVEGVGLVISIHQAKTRRVWANQFVIIRSRSLILWLRWFLEGRQPKERFLAMGRRRWSFLLKDALESLGLGQCHLTLASFRGGGACHHFKTQQNLGVLQFAGRWRRPETLRHYLQEALAVHVLSQVSASTRETLGMVFKYVDYLNQPPRRTWASVLR